MIEEDYLSEYYSESFRDINSLTIVDLYFTHILQISSHAIIDCERDTNLVKKKYYLNFIFQLINFDYCCFKSLRDQYSDISH